MKNAKLLVFITQLGISVAVPPACLILLALWLQNRFGWGKWVMILGVILGLICAIQGLVSSLKAMNQLSKNNQKEKETPPLSFNDHD